MAQKYRLEALVRIREAEKKRQEIALARAIGALLKAREKLKTLEEEKKKIMRDQKESRLKMDRQMMGGSRVGEGCFHVNFLRKLKEDLELKEEEIVDQKTLIEEAVEKTAKTRKNYFEAIKQLRVMQKHKELWLKKLRQKISRQEEKEMDALGQTIHSLRRWRGEKSLFQI